MITIKTNISAVTGVIASKLQKIRDKEYLLRPVATEVIPLMTERIHQKGQDKNNNAIGTYSKGYLAVRQKKYHRSSDPQVIVSLTRQLENDWAVIATPNGYGIGFNNVFNTQKAYWVEAAKDAKIFQLTPSELQYAKDRITELVHAALSE